MNMQKLSHQWSFVWILIVAFVLVAGFVIMHDDMSELSMAHVGGAESIVDTTSAYEARIERVQRVVMSDTIIVDPDQLKSIENYRGTLFMSNSCGGPLFLSNPPKCLGPDGQLITLDEPELLMTLGWPIVIPYTNR